MLDEFLFFVLFIHTELTEPVISQQSIERLSDVEILCSGITSSLPARRIAAFRMLALGHAPDQQREPYCDPARKNKSTGNPSGPASGSLVARATLATDWMTICVAVDLAGF